MIRKKEEEIKTLTILKLTLLAECLPRQICRQIGKFRICLIEAGSSRARSKRFIFNEGAAETAITRVHHHLVSLYFRLLCILTREGFQWRTVSPQVRRETRRRDVIFPRKEGRRESNSNRRLFPLLFSPLPLRV